MDKFLVRLSAPPAIVTSEAERREIQRAARKAAMREHALSVWPELRKRPVGRPSAARREREVLMQQIVDAYADSTGEAPCAEFWRSRLPPAAAAVAAPAAAGAAAPAATAAAAPAAAGAAPATEVAAEAASAAAEAAAAVSATRPYSSRSKVHRLLLRSYCHRWGKAGEHIGWRNGPELMAAAAAALHETLPRSTAYLILQKESRLFADGKGLRSMPNVPQLLKDAAAIEDELRRVDVEPAEADVGGAPTNSRRTCSASSASNACN